MLNSTLLKAAAKVMQNTTAGRFQITAHFFSSQPGATFSFYPFRIDEVSIDCDYLTNFADQIDLTMIISPHDYALMQDQGQDLLCVLTITYVDQYNRVVYNPAPIQRQYYVMINDPRDIRKEVTDAHLYTDPQLTITVRLIESAVYRLLHLRINTIYPTATLTQVVYDVLQKLGIGKVQMTPLDNTHQYDHVEIEGYQGIASVFNYLQAKTGLYKKGCCSYLTNGVMYLYPAYETAPSYDKTVLFYQVDNGRYAGSHCYHRAENNSLSVVVNNQPQSYDLSIAGSENVGTGFIFTRASRLTDGLTTINSQKGAQYTDNSALSVSLVNNRTAVNSNNNIKYVKSTDNPFPHMANLIAHQASLMELSWINADPFRLDPGHAVKFYYDRNETMMAKTGILEKAHFSIRNLGKESAKDIFAAQGQLVLRLSPNETVVI